MIPRVAVRRINEETEKSSKQQRSFERNRDIESELRKRMRLHPSVVTSQPVAQPSSDQELTPAGDSGQPSSRRGIVSINGKDVDEGSLQKRRSA
jgi:hypothetical protein